jgi:hypothetical protein
VHSQELLTKGRKTALLLTREGHLVRAHFVDRTDFDANQKQQIGVEMNPLSALRSEKKLVDVTGIEPVTPCLQSRSTV